MSETVTFFDTFSGGLHRVAKGSNGGTFFRFTGKSEGKGSDGLHALLITDQEVGGSIPSGRTISIPVFPSSPAFPTSGPCGCNPISNLNGGKRWGQQLRKKRCGV